MAFKPKPPAEPTPYPGVTVGDHLYFHHPEHGPTHGKVVAHGKHGCTIEHNGKRTPVTWDRILGHRKRAQIAITPVDQGEDGMIAEHGGKRVYIRGKIEQPEQSMQKSEPEDEKDKKVALDPQSGQYVTSEDGKEGEQQDETNSKFGAHNVKPGDGVKFKAGAFEGQGRVTAAGEHGAHVADHTGREHKVHWPEIHAHEPQEGGEPDDDANAEPMKKAIPLLFSRLK